MDLFHGRSHVGGLRFGGNIFGQFAHNLAAIRNHWRPYMDPEI